MFPKGTCSNPQPHPLTFSHIMEIFIPEVESYLEGFKWHAQSLRNQQTNKQTIKKLSWKLENMITTIYKTMTNIICLTCDAKSVYNRTCDIFSFLFD